MPGVGDGLVASVRDELERILTTPAFARSERLSQFLRFVVEEALAGRADQLKEATVGADVYGRPGGFDPRVDATVRVEAGKLRKRLSEYYLTHGRDSPVVITIPKGGYAPVFEQRTDNRALGEAPVQEDQTARALTRRPRLSAVLVAIGVGVLLVAAVGLWWITFAKRPVRPVGHRLVSTFPGSHSSASFSPDGSMIAFISSVGDPGARTPLQVWVKNLAQGNPIQITFGDTDAAGPKWSPKNDQILFERAGAIWSVPPLGGPARRIIEHGRGHSFSADGTQLAFYRRFEIWVANADGSEQRRLKGVPETSFHVGGSPVFSPDGRWIAFFHPVAGPSGDLWLIPSSGGKGHQLTFDRREGGFPVWSPDGRWIIYSSGRAGSLTLWRVPVRGGAPEALTTGAGEDNEAAISSDGRRLIFTNVRHTWSLMFLDSGSGSHKELLSKRQPIGAPVFSPAGNRITFFHLIEGDSHLFTTDITGEDTQQVTHGRGQENIMPSWSADESALYFYRSHPAPSFRKMSTAGADSAQIAPWVWGTQSWAQVDPSGREAVYTLRERNAPKAAIVRNLATGQERALGMAITRAQWSQDSQLLLGSTHDDRVAICPASGGECALVTRGHHARWSADNTRIYFLRSRGNSGWFELWSASRDGSGEKSIALLGPFRSFLVHFDVSKRGHIVWAPFHEGRQELWLTELR